MSGIVRSRFSAVISKIRAAFNPSASVAANPNRKHSTAISSSSLDQAEQFLKSPPPPLPTGSWKEKLGRNSLKYGLLGTAGIVSTTAAIFIYHPFEFNNSRGGTDVPIRKMNFDFDEHDLVRDEDIRRLYDRWLKHYGFSRYRKDKEVHYQAFKEAAYHVYFFNRTHVHCKFELNKFADYTEEEWKGMLSGGFKLDVDECDD